VKSAEEIMEILEAYDLTGSFRDAAELAGCSHHTVASSVAARERGQLTPGRPKPREMLADPYREKLEEWVDHSRGKVRADVAHDKLIALGYTYLGFDWSVYDCSRLGESTQFHLTGNSEIALCSLLGPTRLRGSTSRLRTGAEDYLLDAMESP